jgi:hypothetical protein
MVDSLDDAGAEKSFGGHLPDLYQLMTLEVGLWPSYHPSEVY